MWEKTPAWKDFCKLQWSVRLHIPEASFLKASKMKRFGIHHVETFPYTWLQFNDEQDFSQAASQKARDNEGEVGVFHCSGPQKLLDWKVSSYDINIGSISPSWYFAGMAFELLILILGWNCTPQIEFLDKFEFPALKLLWDEIWCPHLDHYEGGAKERPVMKKLANTIRCSWGMPICARCSGRLKTEAGHLDSFQITCQMLVKMKLECSTASQPRKENHVTYMLPEIPFENWWAATLFGWLCHVLTCMSFSIGHGQHISRQTPRNALRPSFKCTFAFWPRPPPSSRPSRWKPQTPSTWENHNIKQTVVWLCTKWTMLN